MPATLIDPTKPIEIIVQQETNPTHVVFRPLTVGDKMSLGAVVDTKTPMRSDIDTLCALLINNLVSIEGIDGDLTVEKLQNIEDVSLFWEIAGAVIDHARVKKAAEVN
uniref:Tail assembly chaperone n=1 Tax=viral metagenome TaxID=1070528 RepID=A0A6M3L4M3_9ZZZZ